MKVEALGAGASYWRLQNYDIWKAPYMLPTVHDIDSLLYVFWKTIETTANRETALGNFIAFARRSDFLRLIRRLCAEKKLEEEQAWTLLLHWLTNRYGTIRERDVLRGSHPVFNSICDEETNDVLSYLDTCFLSADDEAWSRM